MKWDRIGWTLLMAGMIAYVTLMVAWAVFNQNTTDLWGWQAGGGP